MITFDEFITFFNYSKIPMRPLSRALGTQTIGTSQVDITHNLTKIPNIIVVQMTSAGTIWQSAAADSTQIHLKADAGGRTCNVHCFYFKDNLN